MKNMFTDNKKILIIEDEEASMRLLADALKDSGFSIIKAKNGKQGLKKALKHRPDLILLDILLPQIDGMTMLKELRKDEWGNLVLVIILTNVSDFDKISEALGNNVYDYLIKTDWKLKDIVTRIKKRLDIE